MLLVGVFSSYIQCTSIGTDKKNNQLFLSQICPQSLECVELDNKLADLENWKHVKQMRSCSAFKSAVRCSKVCDEKCVF